MEVNVGMVFAIILVLIVIGFVLVVGMGQIMDFLSIGGQAQINKAVKDTEKIVEDVYLYSEGSSKTYTLQIPTGAKLCFINKEYPGPQTYTDPSKTWIPSKFVLENFLKNPSSKYYGSNLWIYRQGDETGEGYEIDYLSPSKSFCASGGTELYLENKGYSVDITFV